MISPVDTANPNATLSPLGASAPAAATGYDPGKFESRLPGYQGVGGHSGYPRERNPNVVSFPSKQSVFQAIQTGAVEARPGMAYSIHGQPHTLVFLPDNDMMLVRSMQFDDIMVPEPGRMTPEQWGRTLSDRQRNTMRREFLSTFSGDIPAELLNRLRMLDRSRPGISRVSPRDRETTLSVLRAEEDAVLHAIVTTTGVGSQGGALAQQTSTTASEIAQQQAADQARAQAEEAVRNAQAKAMERDAVEQVNLINEQRRYSRDNPPISFESVDLQMSPGGGQAEPGQAEDRPFNLPGRAPAGGRTSGFVPPSMIQSAWRGLDDQQRERLRDLLDRAEATNLPDGMFNPQQTQAINAGGGSRYTNQELLRMINAAKGGKAEALMVELARKSPAILNEILGIQPGSTDGLRALSRTLDQKQGALLGNLGSENWEERMDAATSFVSMLIMRRMLGMPGFGPSDQGGALLDSIMRVHTADGPRAAAMILLDHMAGEDADSAPGSPGAPQQARPASGGLLELPQGALDRDLTTRGNR